MRPMVAALLRFGWGYDLQEGEVRLRSLARLAPSAWDRHLALLRRDCSAWTFFEGFQTEGGPAGHGS